MEEQPKIHVEVITLKDGWSARDRIGDVYKIESITLGMGFHRKTIKWEKSFLKEGSEVRAEILENGKLNITQ